MYIMQIELQKTKGTSSSDPTTHGNARTLDSEKRMRGMPPTPGLHGEDPVRIPLLTGLIDTYTDEQFTTIIKTLPKGWQEVNEKSTIVKKRQLLMAAWGEYKDDHSALQFQEAILNTKPHPQTIM
jgi:hypothetical protein